jgi:hypothetical protein
MKIKYGTTLTSYHMLRAFFLGCVVFAIVWFNLSLQNLLGESQESILRSRGLNVTHTSTILYCDLPYDDCLCSVLLNKSDTSQNCITYVQLVESRILPLVSFFLQIFLVRELFSLSADRHRVFIYALWIASIFTFIGMTICIYWSSCYHVYITVTMYWTGASLCFLSVYNVLVNGDRVPFSSNPNQIIIAHRSEKNNNASKDATNSKTWDLV